MQTGDALAILVRTSVAAQPINAQGISGASYAVEAPTAEPENAATPPSGMPPVEAEDTSTQQIPIVELRQMALNPHHAKHPQRVPRLLEDPGKEPSEWAAKPVNSTRFMMLLGTGITVFALIIGLIVTFQPTRQQINAEADETAATRAAQKAQQQAEATPSGPKPVIAAVNALDPEGDGEENSMMQDLMIDSNPETQWQSLYYYSPTYGDRTGIGIGIVLQTESLVTKVTLHTKSTGGKVELRATDATTPTKGEVIASGAFAKDTVLTLKKPVLAKSLVLWIPELPTDETGLNRIIVTEMSVE